MNADVEHVRILVLQLDGFLHLAIHLDLLQPSELAHSMIDVGDEVSVLQAVEFLERERFFAFPVAFDPELFESLKELMVCEYGGLAAFVDESGVNVSKDRTVVHFLADVLHDGLKAFNLTGRTAHQIVLKAIGRQLVQPVAEQIELLVERWLGRTGEVHLLIPACSQLQAQMCLHFQRKAS